MKNLANVIKNYKIVFPESGDTKVSAVASVLKKEILRYTDTDIEIVKDTVEAAEYEIIVGLTSRQESEASLATLKTYAGKEIFSVRIVGKKIVIIGLSDDDTVLGVKYFVKNYLKSEPKNKRLSLDKNSVIYVKTGKVLYYTENYDAVVLENLTAVRDPGPENTERFTYGKIVKLEHSGENNGILFATNENIYCRPWSIYRSFDDGHTWDILPLVRDDINIGFTMGYQSNIYELPVDMGKYKQGTLLFVSCTYGKENTFMYLAASDDLGESFTGICNIAEGFGFNKGGWSSDALWEPALIFEESTGRMYCFYSDELENGEGEEHIGGHNQRLVYRYTTDLENWSETYNASALGKLRPGMIALTRLGDGRYAFVGEMVGYEGGGNWTPIKFADTLDSWNPYEPGKYITTAEGIGLGGAPGITWTPDGGDCGTLFVVAHHNITKDGPAPCSLFMSFDYGETFVNIENPIPVRFNPKTYNGYSCGFFTDKDGYVYYINNCDMYPDAGGERLMLAKIKVYG